MNSFKFFSNKSFIYAHVILILCMLSGCNSEDGVTQFSNVKNVLRFAEEQYMKNDLIVANSDEQTFDVEVIEITDSSLPLPKELVFVIHEWSQKYQRWVDMIDSEVNQPDDFYHISSILKNGKPALRVTLKANETNEYRSIYLDVADITYKDKYILSGSLIIAQAPQKTENEQFTLKAKYKGKYYTTLAELDNEGNFIFFDEDYNHLMDQIDNDPSVQMLIMDDECIYYYDTLDIQSNQQYNDINALTVKSENLHTRASGFEGLGQSDLGYVALYENDNFKGNMISRNTDSLYLVWNLQNLKWYDINDKITSIALAYNGTDLDVCSILTVWDDADFNNGDKYRKKHRLNIIATKNSPRITISNLKKVKKIGSSKSWNDCISSLSFHFGYTDSLWSDY